MTRVNSDLLAASTATNALRTSIEGYVPKDPNPRLNLAERFAVKRALNEYLRTDKYALTPATGGGAMMPAEVIAPAPSTVPSNAFEHAHNLLDIGVIEVARPVTIGLPVLDADGGGEVTQGQTGDTEPSTDGMIEMVPRVFSSGSVWFSNTLLEGSVDLVETLIPTMERVKDRAVERSIALTIAADAAITQNVTTAAPATITYAELVALAQSLPSRFAEERFTVLSPTAYDAAERLNDADGRPLLSRNPLTGVLEVVGVPILRCRGFGTLAASHVIGACVSLLGFRMSVNTNYRIARMITPSRPDQFGVRLFADHNFGWVPAAVVKLTTAAS